MLPSRLTCAASEAAGCRTRQRDNSRRSLCGEHCWRQDLNGKPVQDSTSASWFTGDYACAGTSTAWLFPFVDGHPPIGWPDASKYLVLPVLLVSSEALHMLSVPAGRRSFPCCIRLPPHSHLLCGSLVLCT